MDIFWLFFMLSALQPVIKQRLLEASRKRMIALIEEVAAVNDGQSCTRAVHGHTGRLKASFVAKFIRFVVWWSGSSSRHGAFERPALPESFEHTLGASVALA